jgi:hypothetical protein
MVNLKALMIQQGELNSLKLNCDEKLKNNSSITFDAYFDFFYLRLGED